MRLGARWCRRALPMLRRIFQVSPNKTGLIWERLAARLEQGSDDLPGWLRLVRAYTVLDRKDDAQKALARAKSEFAGNAQAIEQLDALAAELGLKS